MTLDQRLSKLTWWLVIIILVTTVVQFSTWGYEATLYLLSNLFNVETDATVFQFLTGVIAMIASVILFAGGCYAWMMSKKSSALLVTGAVGFIIKNIFDISHRIASGLQQEITEVYQVKQIAGEVGTELFQMVFWVFVIVWFSRQAYKTMMIK